MDGSTGEQAYTFLNAEAAALVARFSAPPTNVRKAAIDSFVGSLKSGGIWAKLDALYVMAAHDGQAARRNWMGNLFNLTESGTLSFLTDRGYASGGGWLDTGFLPATSGVKISQNNAHLGVWSLTDVVSDTMQMGVTDGSNSSFLRLRGTGNQAFHRINQAGPGLTLTNTDASGFFIGQRSGATATEMFRNAVSLGTGTEVSGNPNLAVYLCARNNGGVADFFDGSRLSIASIGSAFTAPQIAAFHAAGTTYLQAAGAI